MAIKSYNPANNELIGQVESTPIEEIKNIVENSKIAYEKWGILNLTTRISYIQKLYEEFKNNKLELATLVTNEMGMPITESLLDIDNGLDNIQWYIDNVKSILEEKITYEDEYEINKIIFEPKGVVAVILAWNFPFSSFVWQAISNLIVGNTIIVKHSEYVPLCSQFIFDLVSKILPQNVCSVLFGDGEVGEFLANQDIDMICFTGSTQTGEKLYKIASEKFIPVVLECGGSAPGIVFEDANIDEVIDSIYINRFTNTGQICDGQKRLIVHEKIFEKVCEKLKLCVENKKIGNPLKDTTQIGPLVSISQLEKLEEQLEDAISKGAKILCGGKRLNLDNGNYYLPTILTGIKKDMKVYREEVFGPILPIIKFKTEEEAIKLANDTEFGLGGYIYTQDKMKFNKIAKSIKTGMVCLNNSYYLKPCNPFGGYKKSGIGKNNGEQGLINLCNMKVIAYERE